MNAPLPAVVKVSIPSLDMNEGELIKVLESSVYPGADLASIKLVIGACRAGHLDPLQKPYHIVPMDVKVKLATPKNGKDHEYIKRDVIMPGIGLYRTQAARTSEYAGISEPTFGPDKELKLKYQEEENGPLKEMSFAYPEWCRMTVRRLVGGHIVEFTALEFWVENYATKRRGSQQPNAMWTKRPRGQIAKCAEAQALRKAFPEVGALPTAEEMEGKTVESDDAGNIIDGKTGQVIPPLMAGPQPEKTVEGETATTGSTTTGASTTTGNGNGGGEQPLSDGERAHIKSKMEKAALTELDLKAKFNCDLAGLKASQFKPVKEWITASANK